MKFNRSNPYDVAKKLLKEKYSDVDVAFIAGSFNRGEETNYSDIDLVVVFKKVEVAWRESFIYDGWNVEVFAHDPETLNYFFWEFDAKDGVPALPCMVLEGQCVPVDHPLGFNLKSLADRVLVQGPPVWDDETLNSYRYSITDLIDDLRDPRSKIEAMATIGKLHETLGNFYFRANNWWSASGKHIPRRIFKLDPELGKRWADAFEKSDTSGIEAIISLAEEILQPFGGFLFAGYKRISKNDWRLKLQSFQPKSAPETSEFILNKEERFIDHSILGKIEVRVANDNDVSKLRSLLNLSYKKLLNQGLNYNATFQDDSLTLDSLHDGGKVFILELENKIIGTMKMKNFNQVSTSRCLYISRFAVLPEKQSLGLGNHLLKLAESIARREGFTCMQLDTAQSAKQLIEFYQTQGFKIVKPIYYDGKTYLSWVFQKNLLGLT